MILPQLVMYLQKCYGPLLTSGGVWASETSLYIDDGIVASIAKSRVVCIQHREIVVSDLKKAGFVLNLLKSHLDLQQIGKWLRFIIHLLQR